jgi:hemerythrin superfamily protein
MQPDEIIREDHELIRSLFGKLGSGDDRGGGETALQLVRLLKAHALLEERVFYPEMRELAGLADKLDEGIEEHQEVENLIGQIEGKLLAGRLEGEKMERLQQLVEHHAAEEEEQILPEAGNLPNADQVAGRMQEVRRLGMAGGATLPPEYLMGVS